MMQISKRERRLAVGLTVLLGAWGLYAFALQPAADRIRTLERIIPEKQTQLQDLQAKSAQYVALRSELDQARTQLASQEPGFDLLPFLETMIRRHKLDKHLGKMEPDPVQSQTDYAEAVVKIELHDISLKQLVDFLSAVETSKSLVRVGSLRILKSPKSDTLLDSTVGICSPKLNPPALATHTAP